jgi:integrase
VIECARIGLPRIRFHDMRHTHATHLLASGVHPKVASERLGHSKVGLTLDTYSHVLPNMQADAAALVDDALQAALQSRTKK